MSRPSQVGLIQNLLSVSQDPGHYMCHWMAKGAWLGSMNRKLPRTPAVFDHKFKWRSMEPVDEMHQGCQTNHLSLDEHAYLVNKQFRQEAEEGRLIETTVEAVLEEYCDELNIASTGAIAKKGRTDEVLVMYDGSHGLDLRPGMCEREQVSFPTGADGKVALSEMCDEGGPHFFLLIDFSKPHRRFLILRNEGGRQACQAKGNVESAAKQVLSPQAESSRRQYETHGKKAQTKPR